MLRWPCRLRAGLWAALAAATVAGCASPTYHFGSFDGSKHGERELSDVSIEYGQPNNVLDPIARAASAPGRWLAMDKKVNRHELSGETLAKVKSYLERNDLTDVHVYINHYDPAGQWHRLRANTRVAPVWRYSIGVVSWVGYTVLPDRIFGGDRYNPYTNTLHLNSDVPAIALGEAAFAKDIHARRFPGAYAAINELPIVTIWHEVRAVGDVVSYARDQHDWEVERQSYRLLYPRMGLQTLSAASPLVSVWWGGPLLGLGGAAVGRVAGQAVVARRESERHDLRPLASALAEVLVPDASSPAARPHPPGPRRGRSVGEVRQAAHVEAVPPPAAFPAPERPAAEPARLPGAPLERLPKP